MRLRPLLVGVAAVAVLAGCGLPTPSGVRSGGQVDQPQAQQQAQPIVNRPARPLVNASPSQIVTGFLRAQSSPEDDFAVARSFLTGGPAKDWNPETLVRIFTASDPTPTLEGDLEPAAVQARVIVDVTVTGQVRLDGSAELEDPSSQELSYGLVKVDGAWRLSEVPVGLTVAQSRSDVLAPYAVMLMSPSRAPSPHLVPDLVRLPSEGDALVRRLVQRVLDGPTQALGASAVTAAPPMTTLLQARELAGGVVLVDLSPEVAALDDGKRQELSAQLVWTLRLALPDFTALRLEVAGAPLAVNGSDGPQDRSSYDDLDPGETASDLDALAIVAPDARLVSVAPDGGATSLLPPEAPKLTDAVEDTASGRIAAVTSPNATGEVTLLTGRKTLTTQLVVTRKAVRMSSPTWGDGAFGVWTLTYGSRPVIQVGDTSTAVRSVPVEGGVPALSATSVLRVSRDGSRVALVDAAGILRVGRIEVLGGRPRIVALRPIVTDPTVAVRDVSWVTGTTLLALRVVKDVALPQSLLTISVDGLDQQPSSINIANEANTRTLTASGTQVLVAAKIPEVVGTSKATFTYALYRRAGAAFTTAVGQSTALTRPRLPD